MKKILVRHDSKLHLAIKNIFYYIAINFVNRIVAESNTTD